MVICLFLIPLTLAFLILLWFDTNVIAEYIELFQLESENQILNDYLAVRKAGSPLSLYNYVLQFAPNTFFTRLITCQTCVSTWVGLIAGLVIYIPIAVCFGAWTSICYSFSLPYLTLFFYRLINKIK